MSFAAGHSRAAQSAATTEMNPSTTAATPSRAQPRNAPVIAARSSPHHGQHRDRVVLRRAVQVERLLNDALFRLKGAVRQAAAAPRERLDRRAGQRGQHGGRRRRVADAHLPDADGAHAVAFCCAANSMPMAIARSVSSSLIARSRAILPVP